MQNSSTSLRRSAQARLLILTVCLGACAAPATIDRVEADTRKVMAGEPPLMLGQVDGITATGYAVIDVQKGQTHAQRRLMAIRASKLDAYRNLTEQVYGLYVESATQMGDLSLVNENVRARVQGLVYGSQLVSITPVGGETYETKLALEQEVIDELVSAYREPKARQRSTETVTRIVREPAPRQRVERNSSSNKRWFIKDAG